MTFANRVSAQRLSVIAILALYSATALSQVFYFEQGPQLGLKQACVADTAKVGDQAENINGDQLVVRSLHGSFKSHFSPCQNQEKSILAEVELLESPEFHSDFALDLPPDFPPKPIADRERFQLLRVNSYSAAHHAFLTAHSWDRRRIPDIDAFVAAQKQLQADGGDTTQTSTQQLVIAGVPALRWTSDYKPSALRPHAASLTTVLLGDTEIVVLVEKVISWRAGAYQDGLLEIAQGAHGLTRPVRQSPVVPH